MDGRRTYWSDFAEDAQDYVQHYCEEYQSCATHGESASASHKTGLWGEKKDEGRTLQAIYLLVQTAEQTPDPQEDSKVQKNA